MHLSILHQQDELGGESIRMVILFWRPLHPLQFYLHLNNLDVTLYEADSLKHGRDVYGEIYERYCDGYGACDKEWKHQCCNQ